MNHRVVWKFPVTGGVNTSPLLVAPHVIHAGKDTGGHYSVWIEHTVDINNRGFSAAEAVLNGLALHTVSYVLIDTGQPLPSGPWEHVITHVGAHLVRHLYARSD